MRFDENAIRQRIRWLKENSPSMGMKAMARALGYRSTGGLTHWIARHAPVDLRESLRESHHPGAPPLPREEAIRRLRLAVTIESAGLDVSTLGKWVAENAPDGAAVALADYEDDEDGDGMG